MKREIRNLMLKLLPVQKVILFESNPEMACNTFPIFQEMLKRNLNSKYKMVWLVADKDKYKNYGVKNVEFINYEPKNKKEKQKYNWYRDFACCKIFANRIMDKEHKDQIVINLTHGMPLKSPGKYQQHDTCDYALSSFDKFNDIAGKALDISVDKFVTLGYPRTDIFGHANDSIKKLELDGYNKVIVWMPTFRTHKNGVAKCGMEYTFGVPLLESEEAFASVESVLKEKNIALIVKLHPAEKRSMAKDYKGRNIIFMSDKDISDAHTTPYELLAESDAMITDYSSVYYDYLYRNKPIGLVIDDIELYRANGGLIVPDYKEYIKGTYIENLDELKQFLAEIGDGIDRDYEARQWAIEQYVQYKDFKSASRVVDFLMSKVKR